jgi:hypothetical protein
MDGKVPVIAACQGAYIVCMDRAFPAQVITI